MAFKFEKLKVWQKAIDLSGDRYEFSKNLMFILTGSIIPIFSKRTRQKYSNAEKSIK